MKKTKDCSINETRKKDLSTWKKGTNETLSDFMAKCQSRNINANQEHKCKNKTSKFLAKK